MKQARLWDLDEQALASAAAQLGRGRSVRTWVVDVTSLARVSAATATTESAMGSIDMLVHSAGIAGIIVNIASIAGKEGNPNAAAYSASEVGVIALTNSLGNETARNNIAVNISP